jgi:hypothetical protein
MAASPSGWWWCRYGARATEQCSRAVSNSSTHAASQPTTLRCVAGGSFRSATGSRDPLPGRSRSTGCWRLRQQPDVCLPGGVVAVDALPAVGLDLPARGRLGRLAAVSRMSRPAEAPRSPRSFIPRSLSSFRTPGEVRMAYLVCRRPTRESLAGRIDAYRVLFRATAARPCAPQRGDVRLRGCHPREADLQPGDRRINDM